MADTYGERVSDLIEYQTNFVLFRFLGQVDTIQVFESIGMTNATEALRQIGEARQEAAKRIEEIWRTTAENIEKSRTTEVDGQA